MPDLTTFDRSCTQDADCAQVSTTPACADLCTCGTAPLSRKGAKAYNAARARYLASVECPPARVMRECAPCGQLDAALICEAAQCRAAASARPQLALTLHAAKSREVVDADFTRRALSIAGRALLICWSNLAATQFQSEVLRIGVRLEWGRIVSAVPEPGEASPRAECVARNVLQRIVGDVLPDGSYVLWVSAGH